MPLLSTNDVFVVIVDVVLVMSNVKIVHNCLIPRITGRHEVRTDACDVCQGLWTDPSRLPAVDGVVVRTKELIAI